MDNLRELIIDYQIGVFVALAFVGALIGWHQSVCSKKMYEQRSLKTDNPADRLVEFNVNFICHCSFSYFQQSL